MQLFYLDKTKEETVLDQKESKHAIKILRKKKGDILDIIDGSGYLYKGEIIIADINSCKIKIIESYKKNKKHNYHLHIAIAPTKNISRFEWFLEKATEIGVDEITPIICTRSERKIIKHERCEKILLAATKQSLKFYKPKLNNTINISEFIKTSIKGKKYIAHCYNYKKRELINELVHKKNTILIGPEGDFSINEVEHARKNNFQEISLGKSRLRTETAGIISTHIVNIKNI